MIRKSGIKGEGKIPKVLKITRFCDLIDDTFVLWKKRNLTGKKSDQRYRFTRVYNHTA